MNSKIIVCSAIMLSAFSLNGMNPFFEDSAVLVQPKRQETLQEAYNRAIDEMAASYRRRIDARDAIENPSSQQPQQKEADEAVGCFSCFYK